MPTEDNLGALDWYMGNTQAKVYCGNTLVYPIDTDIRLTRNADADFTGQTSFSSRVAGGFSVGNWVWVIRTIRFRRLLMSSEGILSESSAGDFTFSGRRTGGFSIGNWVWATNSNDDIVERYSVSDSGIITSSPDGNMDVSTPPELAWGGGISTGDHAWLISVNIPAVESHAVYHHHSDGLLTADASKNITLPYRSLGGFSIDNRIWIVTSEPTKDAIAYDIDNLGNATRFSEADVDMPDITTGTSNDYQGGFAVENRVWAIGGNILHSYIGS